MPADQSKTIERKEATNSNLSKEEKEAIDIIKKETDKTKIESLMKTTFNVAEGEKNIETKNNLKFLYESMIDQIYILYKTDKNKDFGRDNKETLDSAFFFMKLYNPDKYANEGGLFQTNYMKGDNKLLFYAAVEQEMGKIFTQPSSLYQTLNIDKQTLDKDVYEKNKDSYVNQGRKVKSEKTVEGTPEKILVDEDAITFPKQYFYRGESDTDVIDKGIHDITPSIKTKIEELKKNSDIDPTSIQLEISGSVSNIKYFDNQALLGRRSLSVQSKLEKSFPDLSVNINNPDYTGYGTEWGPAYPPTVESLNTVFTAESEALKALNKIGSSTMEEVVKSINDQGSNSKYFDVLEQYMYRDYQYAEVKVTYKKREEVPTGKQVLEMEKKNTQPNLHDGMITWKTGQVIAKNPHYEKQTSLKHVYKQFDGVTFPVSEEYIALQLSDNKLTQPTARYGIPEGLYTQKMKHTITNTEYKSWKSGKGANASQELYLNLDTKGVDDFSKNLIKSDEDRGRSITNKETSQFVEKYIMTLEAGSEENNQKEI